MGRLNTCGFCKKTASEDWLVKYGRRHYAHPTCYIKAGKKVSDLPEYEKRYFDSKLHDWLRLEGQRESFATNSATATAAFTRKAGRISSGSMTLKTKG